MPFLSRRILGESERFPVLVRLSLETKNNAMLCGFDGQFPSQAANSCQQ